MALTAQILLLAAAAQLLAASTAFNMSYRELRNFKEILTVLGYPRLISIENFKTPHFELVADILIWLCQRYDKNMEILDTITTEHDRVAFLKSVAEQLLTKARVKLNLKNLYASNGFAVRELLKVATLLYDAHRNASGDAEEGEGDAAATADVGPGHKFTDVKATRRLASDITKYGIRLYELLGTHVEAKEAAARALGKNYDIDDMGRQLREMEGAVSEQTAQMEQMLGNVQQDEANLQVTGTAAAATTTSASTSTASTTATTSTASSTTSSSSPPLRLPPTCRARSTRRRPSSTASRSGCRAFRRCGRRSWTSSSGSRRSCRRTTTTTCRTTAISRTSSRSSRRSSSPSRHVHVTDRTPTPCHPTPPPCRPTVCPTHTRHHPPSSQEKMDENDRQARDRTRDRPPRLSRSSPRVSLHSSR